MADTVVGPQGTSTISVAASAKVATYGTVEYQVFQVVGYPNYPSTYNLLFQGTGAYTSSAFSAAGTVVVMAGGSAVSVSTGTAAVPGVVRQLPVQGTPGTLNATGTLTAALILGQVVTSTTAAAVVATLDTGTVMDAAISMSAGDSFDWSVVNTGANAFTVTASTGHTVTGAGAVSGGTSGRFRTYKSASATFVTIRLS